MKYDIEVIGMTHVATCDNLVDVKKALLDAQCIKNPSIDQMLIMADELNTKKEYYGAFHGDTRFMFCVKVI